MSAADFEVRYIETRWHDPSTLLELNESQYALPLEEASTDEYVACTIIYPKVDELRFSQLAITYTDLKKTSPPVILAADGTPIALKKVRHPETGKPWWIEPGEWDPQNKTWKTNTHRTAGFISFLLGKQRLALHITLTDSSKEQLDKYLIDFKSDMWELVLDESSYIQGEAKQGTMGSVNASTLSLVDSILSHGRNVLKKPKSELRETQVLKPRMAVKPVPRTFMEIATKGHAKLVTSRGVQHNFNVAENSYLLYSLLATHRIVSQLCRVSQSKIERLTNSLNKLDERLANLKDYKTINRDLVVKDYKKAKLEQDVNVINSELQKKLIEINSGPSSQGVMGYLRIQKKSQYGSHFCLYKLAETNEWQPLPGYKFSSINLDGRYQTLFQAYTDYKLTAEMSERPVGGQGAVLSIEHLSSIEIMSETGWLKQRREKFQNMEKMAVALSQSDWKKRLSPPELEEQNKERASIKNRKAFFSEQQQNVAYVRQHLEPKEKQLKELTKQLIALGIKPKSTFPNSMTFVQNPNYQGVHACFKKLKEQIGLTDEDILLSLETIDKIGLVNIPLLYERWCLLQLIKTLQHQFRFSPEEDWKRKLLHILENKSANTAIQFTNVQAKRQVALFYEPRLDNGKRPDFVLEMTFNDKDGGQTHKKVVLDAKFYSDGFMRQQGGLSEVVKKLAIDKDYSENNENSVFILHPTTQAVIDAKGPVSPQEWGGVSYLGELKLFEWDRREQSHQFGAVCLNPLLSHQHGDEIQRMMGMFLQYEHDNNGPNDDVKNHNFCIGCGSTALRQVKHTQSNQRKVWYQCTECDLFAVYNHCYVCNHRLIKNGEHWTYHSTMPMQPINLKCPHCESPL